MLAMLKLCSISLFDILSPNHLNTKYNDLVSAEWKLVLMCYIPRNVKCSFDSIWLYEIISHFWFSTWKKIFSKICYKSYVCVGNKNWFLDECHKSNGMKIYILTNCHSAFYKRSLSHRMLSILLTVMLLIHFLHLFWIFF